MMRFKAGRGSRGVALVEVDGRRVGSVRRFARNDWRAKLDTMTDYPETGYSTREEAGRKVEALARCV